MTAVKELREQLKGPNISIGVHTYADKVPQIIGPYPITIGKYCSLSQEITFLLTAGHYADACSTYPFDNLDNWPEADTPLRPYHKDIEIRIGSDVWIGWGAKILHSSPIGDGAVIGAYSVVRGPVRPYAFVLGNPAREVKRRFSDDVVDRLLELKWWDWPEDKVRANIKLITSADIEGLLNVG